MTTKYLTGAYPGGYTLSASYTGLIIDQTASVGGHGVYVGFTAAVTNLGVVNDNYTGIELKVGGLVTNGSATDTGATIAGGYYGVADRSASGTVINYGTISESQSVGAAVRNDGRLTNGSAADTGALIVGGHFGVDAEGASATVANFGTIQGMASGGVYIFADGRAINGSAGDTKALITGAQGIDAYGSPGATVTNFGAITGTDGEGVALGGGGTVNNGSAADTTALISGVGGSGPGAGVGVVAHSGLAAIANFGTIEGTAGSGVYLLDGGTVTNGSAHNHSALISGVSGVIDNDSVAMTVTNFGAIQGTGGVAVQFKSAADKLIAESGSIWLGAAQGGGGLLDLAAGTGTVTGIGSTGTVSVAEAMTFSGFGSYEFGKGVWTLTGTNTVGAAQTLIDNAKVASNGALTLSGAVSGKGSLTVSGGIAAIDAGASMSVATLSLTGGAASLNESLTFRGSFSESAAATLAVGAGDKLTLTGASSLAGVIDGAGVVSAANATLGKGLVIGGTDALTITGTATQTAVIAIGDTTANAASVTIAKGATWTIGGAFAVNEGTAATSSLTVAGTLVRSGASGTSAIKPATTDSGTIEVEAGTLDFTDALGGSGALTIASGAVLEVDSTAAKTLTVTFSGSSATLALKSPTTFASTIAGYAVGDTIDLLKIAATGASINSKDQLVIVDGTATVATLKLTGTYSGATFTVGSDSHGGTDLTLTAAGAVPPSGAASTARSVQALISAMAGLSAGSGSAAATPPRVETWRPTLLGPRSHMA